jgi:hypothetical protein
MLKFSIANSKIKALQQVKELQKYLVGRKVYSLDLLSGWSCPFAKDCLAKVHVIDGKKKLIDGKETKFRCFSASQEVVFPGVYNLRKGNFDAVRKLSKDQIVLMLNSFMPKNLGICRICVGGDMYSQSYFDSWIEVANMNPDRLFYAYTKSLPYWVARQDNIPDNLILTASYGGRYDSMIEEYGLRNARVVFSEQEAFELDLPIDHTDEFAANPANKNINFSLILHGIQPQDSKASQAIKELKKNKVKFSYNKDSNYATVD